MNLCVRWLRLFSGSRLRSPVSKLSRRLLAEGRTTGHLSPCGWDKRRRPASAWSRPSVCNVNLEVTHASFRRSLVLSFRDRNVRFVRTVVAGLI